MFRICKLKLPELPPVYATITDEGKVVPFYGLNHLTFETLDDLQNSAMLSGETLAEHVGYLIVRTAEADTLNLSNISPVPESTKPYFLPPVDGQEIWAAGVTYLRSRAARMEESATADIYERVYEADRPELFFKTNPHRVSGPGGKVRVRRDAHWNVPEPELALVLDSRLRLVGYTICNDMSSRDIEGENPLYLPQAKIYTGCCAIGPSILLADSEAEAQPVFEIACRVYREGTTVFSGETSTSRMKRTFADLISWLGRENNYPQGVILSTGTGIVPPNEFTILPGDTIEIEVAGIGILSNQVGE